MFKDNNFSVVLIWQAWKRWCTQILSALRLVFSVTVFVGCGTDMIHCYTNMRYIYYSFIRLAMVQRSWFLFLTTVCYSPVTCTHVNLPSFMATSPVTPSSSSTMASSKLAQVGSTDRLKQFAVPSVTVWFLCWRCSHCYFLFFFSCSWHYQ